MCKQCTVWVAIVCIEAGNGGEGSSLPQFFHSIKERRSTSEFFRCLKVNKNPCRTTKYGRKDDRPSDDQRRVQRKQRMNLG
ncbi:hypothetical protein NECAME_04456 [Necator americanus]|uniref:Uncharacterized protein n=1 Tax=Necator americanus TaxID=51031 RepID=W2SSQ8_NECAM|nr:hypothetical protein NECAME_04456 [Necator americanus]ETN72553.1 hypothetical protein NECAME_04456 [Necator americanus]